MKIHNRIDSNTVALEPILLGEELQVADENGESLAQVVYVDESNMALTLRGNLYSFNIGGGVMSSRATSDCELLYLMIAVCGDSYKVVHDV